MLKLSVFTVMLPDLTPEDAAPMLAATGYAGVEWRVTHIPDARKREAPSFWGNNRCTFAPTQAEAERARAITEAAGLAIPGLGTYIDVGDLVAVEQAMQFAQTCGAPQIRVGSGAWPQPDVAYADAVKAAQAFLAGVQDLAQQYRVRGVIEIHHKTVTPSASAARRVVEGLDPAHIGVIHDAGNMAQEGFEEYRMGLELLGPYLAHVHVKNARWVRPDPTGASGAVWRAEWSPLDDGVIDWDALFGALRSVGYTGWLGLEDFSGARPSREALAFDAQFLHDAVSRSYGL